MITLKQRGQVQQLHIEDKPFLILGGELGNSTASNTDYLQPCWDKLVRMNLNTVLLPVYWELLEPEEGCFDFSLVDAALDQARQHAMHLVLLWFGSYKNSMSCYAPLWVKQNQARFPRARDNSGRAMEIMTPCCPENWQTDARTFAALMQHIRQVDAREQTVLMVQVENEVAMVEVPRDYSPEAEAVFRAPVPETLLRYMQTHKADLNPAFRAVWEAQGSPLSGNWTRVFGDSTAAEEIFIAWQFAAYVNIVAQAGKAVYALPLFTNAALNRPGLKPGQYPSGGPLPHLLDVWRAGAPLLDFFAPDIYLPVFTQWCIQYAKPGNPLFIPEAHADTEAAAHAFYALGAHRALGFSPFGIETIPEPAQGLLSGAYRLLKQISPLILEHQVSGSIAGVLLDTECPVQNLTLGNYRITVAHEHTFAWSPHKGAAVLPKTGCLILALSGAEFLVAGTGVMLTFAPAQGGEAGTAGIAYIEEGEYNGAAWVPGRRLNGDQSHQGRHLRIDFNRVEMQRIKLYQYQ